MEMRDKEIKDKYVRCGVTGKDSGRAERLRRNKDKRST